MADQALAELVGTKGYVLGILLSILDGGQHHVLILIGRVLELRRLNGTAHPFLRVGIGRGNHFLAAKLVLRRLVLVLHPLVVLHLTTDGNCLGTDTELGVGQRVLGSSHRCATYQFAVQRSVFLVGVFHLHIIAGGLFEHLLCLYGATFVPPQQGRSCQEQHDTSSDTSKGVAYT